MSMTLIETKALGTAASQIEFTSIPQDATDLMLTLSGRLTDNSVEVRLRINGDTGSNYTIRRLIGSGSAASSDSSSTTFLPFYGLAASSFTSNTFSNGAIYIPNYTGSTTKSISADFVTENNGTESYQMITAGLWNNTAAITSLLILPPTANLAIGTIASLYKITKGSSGGVVVS